MADFNGDGLMDLALPSDNRKQLRIMSFVNGRIVEFANASLPSPIDKAIAVTGEGNDAALTVGLENGEVYKVSR